MTLTAIEFESAPTARLLLRTSGTPAYTSYSPAPDTFVVDLSNASKAPSLTLPAAVPGITSVTAEEVTEMGARLTRVTVHLAQPSTPQAAADDHAVAVTLPAKEEPLPAVTPVVEPVVTSEPIRSAAVPAAGGDASRVPGGETPPSQPAETPALRAKTLKSVSMLGTSVQLAADGDLAYNAFNLEKPSRLVIDLNGVTDKVAKGIVNVGGAVVKKIRVAQFKGGAEPVTRVVLDLAAKSPYQVTKDGDRLLVTFSDAVATAEVKKPEPPPAPVQAAKPAELTAQVPVIAEPVPEKAPEAKAEWKMPEKRATGVIRAPKQTTSPKPATKKTTPAVPPPQPVQPTEDVFTDAPQGLPTLGSQQPSNLQQGQALQTLSTAAAGGRTLTAGERVYTGEPISLNLKDADLKDVIRTFANLTGLNIAVDPGVGGSVTVDFNDVPWDQALDIILRQNNLGYVLEGNVMRVGTLQRLAEEAAATRKLAEEGRLNVPLRTVSYKLSYARATDVATLLAGVASARAKIIIDARTNQLIISEIPSYLETMRALIDSVDVPTRQVIIEARIVETSKSFIQQYGFQWGFRSTLDPSLGTGTGLVFPNRVDVVGGPFDFGPGLPVLSFHMGNVLGTFNLDLQLNASETEGLVRVVSAPRVQTQDNVSAEIQSGFQIPYQTRVNFTTTVAYVDATLRLSVTPQITEAGTIIMDINVQKNEPATGLAVEGGAGTPLSTRTAHTKLMVRDGGTAVIAGIYQTKENNAQTRLPFLHQLPIIGNLFKTHNISTSHDELMIFITPRIVRSL
jgi:type IV pilus assembly protein PilQ